METQGERDKQRQDVPRLEKLEQIGMYKCTWVQHRVPAPKLLIKKLKATEVDQFPLHSMDTLGSVLAVRTWITVYQERGKGTGPTI